MKKFILLLLVCTYNFAEAQTNKKALFLGNSYTYYNNLPQMIENLADANGDGLIHDSNTPGGYQLNQHATNTTTLNKIAADDWDYVIIQEQSQKPSFPPTQVATDVMPYAATLNNAILTNNSCSKTMFFMTWGRQNGDAQNCQFYTPLCTYEGMQGRLRESYLEMTVDNDADCAPVGVAWKKVREDFPAINLYTSDGSHPSIYGSYLAACVFYTSMFHKSTVGNTYWSTLDSLSAYRLQDIASSTVLDSLSTWSIETMPTNIETTDSTVTFCDSVEVLGNWYTVNTQLSDTINGVGSCAEIINYTISHGGETIDSVVNFCDSIEVLGNWYFTDTSFLDTTIGIPCNLHVNYEFIKSEAEFIDTIITSCDSILVNGTVFNKDTVFLDSIYSPCLTIYNYELNIENKNPTITSFIQDFALKTQESTGIMLIIGAIEFDTLLLYRDTTLIWASSTLIGYYIYNCGYNNFDQINLTLVAKTNCKSDSLTQKFFCQGFSSTNSLGDNNQWQISPNPTNSFLEIKSETTRNFMVSMLDVSGKVLINSQKANQQYIKLNVAPFEKGIYFLIIYDEDNTPIGQQKVVIN